MVASAVSMVGGHMQSHVCSRMCAATTCVQPHVCSHMYMWAATYVPKSICAGVQVCRDAYVPGWLHHVRFGSVVGGVGRGACVLGARVRAGERGARGREGCRELPDATALSTTVYTVSRAALQSAPH